MLLAGALPLAQQEKHSEMVMQLQHDKMEAQRLREEAAVEHSKAEEKITQLEVQQLNLQELIASLSYVARGYLMTRGRGACVCVCVCVCPLESGLGGCFIER